MVKRAKIYFTLIAFIIGFMIAVQFQTVQEPVIRDTRDIWELRDSLSKEMDLQSKLLEEIRLNDKRMNDYASEIKGSQEEALKQTLSELKKEAGLTEVKGPGLTLTIAPIDKALLIGKTIHSVSPITLKRLINELNMYGAKYISIDGERIINTTVIRDINGETKVGTHSLNLFPFNIHIITENMEVANKMYNRMQISPSIDDFFIDNLVVEISKPNESILVPAHVESIRVQNMEPVEDKGES
ncbi:DUF881 domain-containing protein [Lederbergia citrea]|uniref:DUF881 domain-containing protein n=1 Tax=Lederbergia citrea TaxID=2833581 RepID=A0A942Z3I4_9BACI|nr:DUF881 domain-containing protein [Lederbergia citrea]MBS4203868.1 DUF881 domain-containing protein [Lederbergia citrea]MBS4221547.1 DUF881 domain-containing protein [Lederbergia citrea]